jgi:cAMP-binding proteins - catabolite gene activator and regulatory subunit of cAMP-dependent protein kinases
MMGSGSAREVIVRTRDQRIAALGKVPLLAGLSKRDLGRILQLGKEVEFTPGQVIVAEGDRARDFYMILLGKADLLVPGRARTTLGPGDYFGEIAVLDGGPRTATITARTRVSALRIDGKDFVPLLDRYGSIARKILVEMTKRVRAGTPKTGSARH